LRLNNNKVDHLEATEAIIEVVMGITATVITIKVMAMTHPDTDPEEL
jgi:hypothetical protein